jgi:hypothetical protein
MILEQIDSRVLGALRLVDGVTGRWLMEPLQVSAPGARFVRNGHGAYVLVSAPGLADYTSSFHDPPPTPAIRSVPLTVTVSDPTGRYLSRRVALALPRDPDPKNADQSTSLFQAVEAPLYPSPAGEVVAGAAVLRVSVHNKADGSGLAGALLYVTKKTGGQLLARGLTDGRGEALVPVPGIPVMTWDSGHQALMVPETPVVATAYFDPNAPLPADPDDLEARRASPSMKSASADVKLASRRENSLLLELTIQ